MARLLIGGLEIQTRTGGYWFDVVDGDPFDLAEWVGEDDEVMGATGRAAGAWLADTRPVRLHGTVWGDGATAALIRASFKSRMDALKAKMSPATPVSIVAHPPNFALATGTTATLSSCRPERIVPVRSGGWEWREMNLELRSIASPPDWVIA